MKDSSRSRSSLIGAVVADIGRARNVLWAELNAAVRPLGITSRQMDVLLLIEDGAADCAAGLARVLGLDAGMLTRVLDALEAAGMVSRARTQEDRRLVRVKVTDLGRQVVGKGPGPVQSVLDERFASFTLPELEQASRLLGKLLRGSGQGTRLGEGPAKTKREG